MNRLMPRREFLSLAAQGMCLIGLGSFGSCGDASCRTDAPYYLKPARMWKRLEGGAVRCLLCPNACELGKGERGVCRARQNINGELYTLVYSRIVAEHVDPIEKKPLYHFLPGSTAYSVATGGCNLSCAFCQNWQISQADPNQLEAEQITPADICTRAKRAGSPVIAFTYNEPTVQFEYVLDASAEARRRGLRSVIISNGYIMPEAGRMLARGLDAIKIDLKAFTERFYAEICGGRLSAVKDNLVSLHAAGKWIELVVLVIPTLNDSPAEIKAMASWVRKNLSADVPMHFTRFHAMYRLQNLPPTPIATLERCREIARAEGIRYAYVGNVPGHRWENTYCHSCGAMIIRRSGFMSVSSMVRSGRCPRCRTVIPGVWA